MAYGIIRKIAEATATLAGLMSAADKAKLDGVETGATKTDQVVDDLYSTSTTAPLSANQGRLLRRMFEGSEIKTATYTLALNADTEYTMVARKYGRMVILTCNTGSAVNTATAANKVLCTLESDYRPVGGCWFVISIGSGATARITVATSGAVTLQDALSTGTFPRFTAAYISAT